ncbi:hypothetical protein [Amylibacter sp. IMCC11727]|uniref:hypothetical protein n=1 Tax=Amylibacter sp. IMCC11727 TaxID=3039851 RepID=UPI00244DA544|nr:hypothetical protein [Amylibacter sp. IMCC11727]WGI21133.1 hypothetical protein QBD29_13585 [Amylibacter sp. IMCC11727]
MATLKAGDLAALISGSPRMAVESVDGDNVSLVWCNEGVIHRDTFDKILLKRWEVREGGDDRGGKRFGGGDRGGDRGGRGGFGGGDRGGDRKGGKTGWDGKPREKSHFRKD